MNRKVNMAEVTVNAIGNFRKLRKIIKKYDRYGRIGIIITRTDRHDVLHFPRNSNNDTRDVDPNEISLWYNYDIVLSIRTPPQLKF